MATGRQEAPCSLEGLICPLCLDVFDDATLLSCEHTFCRKCLKRYDASHQDRDHMVCPLCRRDTMLQENRVEGLRANVTVNGLVDDYHSNRGGLYAPLNYAKPKCTACAFQRDAVSFCKECNSYMCDKCTDCHKHLSQFFSDHQVLIMSEIDSGIYSIHLRPERCPIHRQESKDLFCEECKVYICLKCVIVGHRDHKIKNQPEFERELRQKVDSLLERCKAKKRELEKNIQNTETRRREVHTAVEKLEAEVRDVYEKKARQLKENERMLIENLQSLKKGFDDDLDALKAMDRQRIKSLFSSVSLVDNDRLGCLEADSLAAHCLLCDELEQILTEVKDDTSARVISGTARRKMFMPAHGSLLHLGEIIERGILQVKKTVDLRDRVCGMTAVTHDAVIVGYGNEHGADKVDSQGNTSQHFPRDRFYCFPAHQSLTGNTVVTWDCNTLGIYSQSGLHIHTKHIENTSNLYPTITSNYNDEIIIANRLNCIAIYDPSISTKLCSITTKVAPYQALETRSGAMIASTCNKTNRGKVTVYDRRGRVGDTLTADPGEYLYAAADSKDRVYVASVKHDEGRVVITQYKINRLKLKKVFQFDELKLTLGYSWCNMISLSCDTLAFVCGKKLYFIEVRPHS